MVIQSNWFRWWQNMFETGETCVADVRSWSETSRWCREGGGEAIGSKQNNAIKAFNWRIVWLLLFDCETRWWFACCNACRHAEEENLHKDVLQIQWRTDTYVLDPALWINNIVHINASTWCSRTNRFRSVIKGADTLHAHQIGSWRDVQVESTPKLIHDQA